VSTKAKYFFCCLIIIGGLLALFGGQSAAATTQNAPLIKGITISPIIRQVTLGPGLITAKTEIQITNSNSYTFTAGIKAVDFKALEESTGVTLSQLGTPLSQYGLADWMNLPGGNSIVLDPGKSIQVEVDIDNRSDLTVGGHYGAVVISTSSGSNTGTTNTISLNQVVASLYFVTKTGGFNFGVNLTKIATNSSHDGIPNNLALTFESTGNSFITPRGYVEISDRKGRLVERGIINEQSNLIIQGTSETLNTPLQTMSPATLNGRYKISAYYEYQGAQSYSIKTIYFTRGFYINPDIIYAVVTGAICLLLLYFLQRKLF